MRQKVGGCLIVVSQLGTEAVAKHPEIERVEISGAVYDIESGQVEWME